MPYYETHLVDLRHCTEEALDAAKVMQHVPNVWLTIEGVEPLVDWYLLRVQIQHQEFSHGHGQQEVLGCIVTPPVAIADEHPALHDPKG